MNQFPDEIKAFMKANKWIFAKTYADTWPHHYLVIDRVDNKDLFSKMAAHIRQYGYLGTFYKTPITYYEEDGMVYWTMVPPEGDPKWYPVEKENIINRCPKEDTYESRLAKGTLPKEK